MSQRFFFFFFANVPRAPAIEKERCINLSPSRPGPSASNRVRPVCALVSLFRALPCAAVSLSFCPVPPRTLPSRAALSVARFVFACLFPRGILLSPRVPYAVVPYRTVTCLAVPARGMTLSCISVPCCVIPSHVLPCQSPSRPVLSCVHVSFFSVTCLCPYRAVRYGIIPSRPILWRVP